MRRIVSIDERLAHRKANRKWYGKKRRAMQKDTDRKVLLSVRVPEQLLAVVNRLVTESKREGKYTYKDRTDCVTDLLRRGVGSLKDFDDTAREAWPGLQVDAQLERVAQLRRHAQTIVNRLHEEVSEFEAVGAHESALQYFHATMDAIRQMPPTAYKDWAIKKLKKEFPKYAAQKKAPGVRLIK